MAAASPQKTVREASARSVTVKLQKFDWRRGNVIAVPSWHNFSHFSETESILFEINDEPVIQAFGWYREE